MNTQMTTREHITQLIEFRQALYSQGFQARRDALFEVLDAVLASPHPASFAHLSQSEWMQRQWGSLYAAVEDGQLDCPWLRTFLLQQVPREGVCVFPLDGSAWPRPRARTLEDLQYVYQASSDVNGGTITQGYPYSLLEWCAEPRSSWSLSVDIRRITSTQTALEVGAAQVQALAQARTECTGALDIVPADAKYSAADFLEQVQGLRVGIVARLACNRVLYQAAPPASGKRGRPRKHGARFALQEPATWGPPTETQEFEDPQYGRVCLERWRALHGRKAPQVSFDVVRARIHQERAKPPAAVWFAWLAPTPLPAGLTITAQTIWRAYTQRWPAESGIQFRKTYLGWTLPKFQHKETGDTWSVLVTLAHWLLFLARPLVADAPLPWQKAQTQLTPQRVRQSLKLIFALIGTPTKPPKPRGKSPGWPKGKQRTSKKRCKVVKKGAVAAPTT